MICICNTNVLARKIFYSLSNAISKRPFLAMKKFRRYLLAFVLTIGAQLLHAQSPEDIATEIFEVLVARDRDALSLYKLDYNLSEYIYYKLHIVDSSISAYNLVAGRYETVSNSFLDDDFISSTEAPTLQKIEIDYSPSFIYNLMFPEQTKKDVENADNLRVVANVYFENKGINYLLKLPLIKFNNAYYLVTWFDFFPVLYRQHEIKKNVKVKSSNKITFKSGHDVLWDIISNDTIAFDKHSMYGDIYRLESGIGIEAKGRIELNMLLSYNGEKGRFGYIETDKAFSEISYSDVKQTECDLRYINDIMEIKEFLFKDTKDRFFIFRISDISEETEELTLEYIRLN